MAFVRAMKVPPTLIAICLLGICNVTPADANCTPHFGGKAVAWIAGEMIRVRPTDAAKTTTVVTVEAGRGEYVAFQPVIRGTTGALTNVRVLSSPLTGPGTIAATNIEVSRESYINVPTSSPHKNGSIPLSPDRFPDGLIPTNDPATGRPIASGAALKAQGVSVEAGHNQPYWVDIFVPRGTPPGNYTGAITVKSDQGCAIIDVKLKVWRFELPLKPALHTSFGMWRHSHTEQDYTTIMKHRLQPISPPRYDTRLKQDGLSLNNLGFASGGDVTNCAMSPPPPVSILQSAVKTHASGIVLYNQTADEIGNCPSLAGTIAEWGTALHNVGVKQLLTMPPRSNLYRSVDIWAIVPWQYVEKQPDIGAVEANGGQMWSYTALNQDTYSPKWQIDFSPMNYRIYGFLNRSVGAKGLLYWNIDNWTTDPWVDPYSYGRYPGEGFLVYPGSKVGLNTIVPSMRLKYIRAAVQDYEYVDMLSKLGRGEWARKTIQPISLDWKTWSDDPAKLAQIRHTLALELDRLSSNP